MRNYYDLLEINSNCSIYDIKKKYIKLALIYHPDRGGDAQKFIKITEAYSILSDIDKKIEYDIKLNNVNNSSVDIFDSFYTRNTFFNLESILNDNYSYSNSINKKKS